MSTRNYIQAPSIYRVLILLCIWRAQKIVHFLSTTYLLSSTTNLLPILFRSYFSLFFSLQKLFCQIFDQRFPPQGGQRPPRIGHKCLQNRQAYLHDATKEHDIQYIIILLLYCVARCFQNLIKKITYIPVISCNIVTIKKVYVHYYYCIRSL